MFPRFVACILAMLLLTTTLPVHAESMEEQPLNLIPKPREVARQGGEFALPESFRIFLDPAAERPEHLAALRLIETVESFRSDVSVQLDRPAIGQNPPGGHFVLRVRGTEPADRIEAQGYTLRIAPELGVLIEGNTVEGLYHGIQTLDQLLVQFEAQALPALEINDVPDFEWRGFYHDITRGKVPTLETMKEIVDYISERKMNMFQLYVEHTFLFRFDPEIAQGHGGLTHQDVLELQEYCRDRRVLLVPSLQSFGHMGGVLSMDRYRHLADVELEKEWDDMTWRERMLGGTIDMSSEEARALLTKMHEEYNALHDAPFSNVCADETYDLGKGKTEELAGERGTGRIYLDHIEWLNELTKSHGKRMMFWGDIVKQHPDLVPEIPRDTILLNWGYHRNTDYESTRLFKEAGLDFFVCPGTNGWRRIINGVDNANENIRRYAETGKRYGAMGLLNTDWGDYGHYNLLGGSMHGIALGAAMAWNTEGPDSEEFNRIWNAQTFATDDTDGVDALFALSPWADANATWIQLYTGFDADVYANFEGEKADELEQIAKRGAEIFARYSHNPRADRRTAEELRFGFVMLELLAEKGRLAIALREDPPPPGTATRLADWANRLEMLQPEYNALWLARNQPSELFKIEEEVANVIAEARQLAAELIQ